MRSMNSGQKESGTGPVRVPVDKMDNSPVIHTGFNTECVTYFQVVPTAPGVIHRIRTPYY